jgi:predicted exporter
MLVNYAFKSRRAGLILTISSIFFFYFTLTGRWSAGAGIGARLFPQLSLAIMLLTGISILFFSEGGDEDKYKEVTTLRVLIFMSLAVLFVLGVLKLGLAVSTFLYLFLIFFYFGKDEGIISKVLIPALANTLFIWGLFTYFAQIILPPALLF